MDKLSLISPHERDADDLTLSVLRLYILSRSPALYSTRRLYEAALGLEVDVRIINHMHCELSLTPKGVDILYWGESVLPVDAILPRIGTSVTEQGAAVIRHFAMAGVYSPFEAESLLATRNKFSALQILHSHGIPIPRTLMSYPMASVDRFWQELQGRKIVIKPLVGTQGEGVILINNLADLIRIGNLFQRFGRRYLLQEYIEEAHGQDIRAFVVGDEVVAAVRRTAAWGDFRSNFHRGSTLEPIELTDQEYVLAVRAAATLKIPIAGVDIIRSHRGPLILEVNASPGLEGIERATQIPIAEKIILYLQQKADTSIDF